VSASVVNAVVPETVAEVIALPAVVAVAAPPLILNTPAVPTFPEISIMDAAFVATTVNAEEVVPASVTAVTKTLPPETVNEDGFVVPVPMVRVPKRAELVPKLPVVKEAVEVSAIVILPTPLVTVVELPTIATPFATVAVPLAPVKTGVLSANIGTVKPSPTVVLAAYATLETDPPKRAQIATEIALPLNLTILKPVSF
jgi:hypothetical protein